MKKMDSKKSANMDQEELLIWDFILRQNDWITATHIPRIFNEEADIEPRKHETRTECMPNSKGFESVIDYVKFRPSIDFFASRINSKLPHFIPY